MSDAQAWIIIGLLVVITVLLMIIAASTEVGRNALGEIIGLVITFVIGAAVISIAIFAYVALL